jgi:hypothetical protein
MHDIDPPEQPCELCAKMPDDCECIECPTCGSFGCIAHEGAHSIYQRLELARHLVNAGERELKRRSLPMFEEDPLDAMGEYFAKQDEGASEGRAGDES